jgi:prophage antirepressor-like protein
MSDSTKIVDVANLLFKYANNTVYMVIADGDNEPWFNAKDCARFFGYSNIKRVLKYNISTENKKSLKDIVSAYKLLYKNIQGHAVYINENGFYELLSKSNKVDAREIQKWLATEVMPQLRKEGHYEIEKRLQHKLTETNNKLEKIRQENVKIKNRNRALENNQTKKKYPDGGSIYILRPSVTSDRTINKIGKSKNNLRNRFSVYNTTVPDDVDEKIYIPVEDPDGTEQCLKGLLHKYRYRQRKEYYRCSIKEILRNLDICVFATENKHIDVHRKGISRSIDDVEDLEEDFEFDDSDEDTSDDESDNEDDMKGGGNIDYEYGYYKYSAKYLKLLLDVHRSRS